MVTTLAKGILNPLWEAVLLTCFQSENIVRGRQISVV